MSWNGATEVEKWKLYESNADGTQRRYISKKDRHGFETKIKYEGFAEYVVVEALDSTNRPIGRSHVVRTIPPLQGLPEGKTVIDWSQGPTGTPSDDLDSEGVDSEDFDSEDIGKSWGSQTVTNPISTYIAGFFTCAAIWAGIRIAERMKGRSWQHRASAKYKPLESKDYSFLLGEGEEDEVDDHVELDD